MLESALRFEKKRFNRDTDALKQQHSRPSKLFLTVVEAWDLPIADANGLSDPFIEIVTADKNLKSVTRSKTLNPRFNYDFTLSIRDGMSSITCLVRDEDVVRNETLGGFDIPLSSLSDEKVHVQWFNLYKVCFTIIIIF